MGDGWLTTAELLKRQPLPGNRPDAVLKRLRDAGVVARPVIGHGRGRGGGVEWLYPPGTDQRLADVKRLRQRGIRSVRELHWELWFAGADNLWPRVKADLVDAFPSAEFAELARLRAIGGDVRSAAIASASEDLGEQWRSSRYPAYDRRAVTDPADVDALALGAISGAIPEEALDLDQPLDVTAPGETLGSLDDRAWGNGSDRAAHRLWAAGIEPAKFEGALRAATAGEARAVATFWKWALDPRTLRREMQFFGRQWSDRAVVMAAHLQLLRGAPLSSDAT